MPGVDASRPIKTLQILGFGLLSHPPIPQDPANRCCDTAPADYGYWAHTLLVDSDEAHDEYDDGAHMLDNDRGVGHQRPEIVRFQGRVAL